MNTEFSLIINGCKVTGDAGCFDVINPATEEIVAQSPLASAVQLDQAVTAAQAAFEKWRFSADQDRKNLLLKIADKIEANAAELAKIVVQEQGKPLFLAQAEVGGAIAWTRATADLELPVEVLEDSDSKRVEIHRKALGVVGSITPWNWPLMIAVWHIMPAIRSGNSVVCKPSGLTPLNTLRLVEIINEVAPAGLVNIVTGEGEIGNKMSTHTGIRKIVFTGSTPTGQAIMRGAADNLKRLTLELGGNDAGIVLRNANPSDIAEGIFQAAFLNMGQTCAALKRLYVHDDIYDELCEKLADIAAQQTLGNGLDDNVTFGPIQNRNQLNLVNELVEDAKANGARVLIGGKPVAGKGYFYPPTIVSEVVDGTRLVDEEQFGPVLPIIRYNDINNAIWLANDCENGLGGSVWGSDTEEALAVAIQLECGTAWINCHSELLPYAPFGGCKMSGFGVEFGQEGLLEYTVPQVLNINK
jgi:acyl-CoA reductase-like NAD-dependent aldehyde dehydrogenase